MSTAPTWLKGGLTAVPGVRVGQVSDPTGSTGVTVALFDAPVTGGADVRGGASGTRQFAALDPLHVYGRIHGVCFAGGSAFGLDAASGVVRLLEREGRGLEVFPGQVVPIVPSAIVFDLGLAAGTARPDADLGEAAAMAADRSPVAQGSVGAGTGATVGKCMGIERAMKGGVGSAALALADGTRVGALVVVNAFGDVVDPDSGAVVAGLRQGPRSRRLGSSARTLLRRGHLRRYGEPEPVPQNTTLALVATEAPLTRVELTLVARLASHGMIRTVNPCQTPVDGDLVVAVGTSGREVLAESRPADAAVIGMAAAEAVARSILAAVRAARGVGPIPGLADRA